jgi:hypothetical protein
MLIVLRALHGDPEVPDVLGVEGFCGVAVVASDYRIQGTLLQYLRMWIRPFLEQPNAGLGRLISATFLVRMRNEFKALTQKAVMELVLARTADFEIGPHRSHVPQPVIGTYAAQRLRHCQIQNRGTDSNRRNRVRSW